jgi:hypothetical protein
MQSDYTKKTKELAEERKYADNFAADLVSFLENPQLIDSFKQLYPKKYHAYVEGVIAKSSKPGVEREEQSAPVREKAFELPPELQKKLSIVDELQSKVSSFEKAQFEKEVAAIESQLSTIFSENRKKYPMANEEAVIARGQALIDRGVNIDDRVWSELWKSQHEQNKAMFDSIYKEQISKQKEANGKAQDIGSGGGIPGQAPKKMTFKEATEAAIRDFSVR